jgi:hypothetical protein
MEGTQKEFVARRLYLHFLIPSLQYVTLMMSVTLMTRMSVTLMMSVTFMMSVTLCSR